MRITLHRTDAKRYWTEIERDDGGRFEIRGIGFMGALPHDLAHFVVETELSLRNGFWGSVAAGAVVDSMTAIAGRRPFHADAKSAAVIRTHQIDLSDCELLVGAFTDALEKGLPHLLLALGRLHKAGAVRNVTVGNGDALRVLEAVRGMQAAWDRLPVDGVMHLAWPQGRTRRAG